METCRDLVRWHTTQTVSIMTLVRSRTMCWSAAWVSRWHAWIDIWIEHRVATHICRTRSLNGDCVQARTGCTQTLSSTSTCTDCACRASRTINRRRHQHQRALIMRAPAHVDCVRTHQCRNNEFIFMNFQRIEIIIMYNLARQIEDPAFSTLKFQIHHYVFGTVVASGT